MRESVGTSKKLQLRVERLPGALHDDIATALKGARVENPRGPYRIDAGRLVNMARDADLGFDLLDEAARRGAADRLAAQDPVATRPERRGMADHQQRATAAHLLVTCHQRCVNLFLAKLGRSVEGCDVGAAASENRDSVA